MKVRYSITNIYLAILILAGFFNWGTSQKYFPALALSTYFPHTILTWSSLGEVAGLWLVLTAIMLYRFGNELENTYGAKSFGALLALFTLLGGVSLFAGASILAIKGIIISGAFLVSTSIFTLWAMRNPEANMCIGFGLQGKAKWFALVYALLTLVGVGGGQAPALGFFALVPLVVAALMGTGKIPVPFATYGRSSIGAMKTAREKKFEKEEFDSFITKVRDKAGEREEKERLRKLFENSLIDDPEDRQAK